MVNKKEGEIVNRYFDICTKDSEIIKILNILIYRELLREQIKKNLIKEIGYVYFETRNNQCNN